MKGDFSKVQCFSCGVEYYIPTMLEEKALAKRGGSEPLYCPNGHKWWYIGETEAEKMRRERDRAVQEQARLSEELQATQRREAKLHRRIGAGMCPCCNRNFSNVARHMKTKHPEIVPLRRKA